MMDRISQLPDFIVHHILSFLKTPTELVRMSVLSKTWFHLTASFPILYFKIQKFSSRQSFFKHVEYTTSGFCQQDVTADKLTLITTIEEPAELDIVNKCLDLVFKKGAKLMLIDITKSLLSANPMPTYRLPNTLLSVSVLKTLTIRHCELPSSLTVDAIKFKSLIQLALVEVPISDEMIKCLATNCPLLQVFTISNCHGFKRFCVYGHQNLQRVRIFYTAPIERIDIEAPNLYDLLVSNWARREAPKMSLVSCQKLTTLTYYWHSLPNSNDLNEFLSNFPLVENLVLVTTSKCYNFKLSSHTLRTLVLHSNHQFDLADIEFNTPNLGLFIYSCNASNHRPLITHARLLQACLQSYPSGQIIEAVWFRKLRQFLDNGSGFKDLNFYFHTRKFTELEKLKAVELPPYEVNHVELLLDNHEDHAAFVDAVLLCCRPQSLTLRSPSPLTDFEEQSGVVKFTYEKLLQQEDEGRTNIQIVSPCSSLLMSLSGEGRAISFMKEEVIQGETG